MTEKYEILKGLKPEKVFKYFETICSIPHGSRDTKKISDYIVENAKENNLDYIQDDSNNVIVFKGGSAGYEDHPAVILQGHMDMVCEKENSCDIDFTKDGLTLEVNDGIITAKGTTLGGDDGIAVAYMLALLNSDDIPHPPLECVFTVDEEIGMLGAAAIDLSSLKGRTLLNLDSEDEGHLLVGCAGGMTAISVLPLERMSCVDSTTSVENASCVESASSVKNASYTTVCITVTGLKGGHSGVEIDKGRANSNMLLGRVLYSLKKAIPEMLIISVEGGLKDNAIPRESSALLTLPVSSLNLAKEKLSEIEKIFDNEYRTTDPDIKVLVEESVENNCFTPCSDASTKAIIAALVNMPNGIYRYSFDIDGLVQTSLNLGILTTSESETRLTYSVRSSVESEKQELYSRIECLSEALGGHAILESEYPAWEYRQDSPLRDMMQKIFEKQYGHPMIVETIHAGLECGLFAGKINDLDIVSFGPDMKDIHTTSESMDVKSVERTWNYLLEVLKEL